MVDASGQFVQQWRLVATPRRVPIGQLGSRQPLLNEPCQVLERQVKDDGLAAHVAKPGVAKIDLDLQRDGYGWPLGRWHNTLWIGCLTS